MLNNIMYADDYLIMPNTKEKLQTLGSNINEKWDIVIEIR